MVGNTVEEKPRQWSGGRVSMWVVSMRARGLEHPLEKPMKAKSLVQEENYGKIGANGQANIGSKTLS